MRELTRVAGPGDEGRPVKYFVRGDMGVSHHQFASLKARGGLRINGQPVHANAPLHPGDAVTVLLEDAPRAAVVPDPTPVHVVYEDEDILILDKPAPLPTQCSPKQAGMTLENRLAWRYRDVPGFTFRPLNRLDRGTSGLMAAAKNAHAAQRLQKQLHTDQFVREYLAVVVGRMEGEGTIDAPIAKERAATIRRVVDRRTACARSPGIGWSRTGNRIPSCACGWRRAGPTRSGCTSSTLAILSPGTFSTVARTRACPGDSRCTQRTFASRIPSPAK